MLLSLLVMLLAAAAPALWLMRRVYRLDTVEKEPASLLWRLLLYGMLSTVPALVLEYGANALLNAYMSDTRPAYHLLESFLGVALIEEGCKYFFLRRLAWKQPAFNFRYDGVVYAVFVSLGFALIENISYVFTFGVSVALSRALLAVPMHGVCGVYMGIWLGQAKVSQARGEYAEMRGQLGRSLWQPILLHGVYDACLLEGTRLSLTVFVIFVLILFCYTLVRLRQFSARDQYIPPTMPE